MVYGNVVGFVVGVIIICKFLPQLHASIYAKVGPLYKLNAVDPWLERHLVSTMTPTWYEAKTWFQYLPSLNSTCAFTPRGAIR
jgi:hypothetical protein